MGMGSTIEGEGKNCAFAGGMPLDVQPVEPIEPLTRIGADRGFMGGDLLHTDPHHIVHSHTKPDLLDNAGCSGQTSSEGYYR